MQKLMTMMTTSRVKRINVVNFSLDGAMASEKSSVGSKKHGPSTMIIFLSSMARTARYT